MSLKSSKKLITTIFADLVSVVSVVLGFIALVATTSSFYDFKAFSEIRYHIFIALLASAFAAIVSVSVSRMREFKLRQRRIFIIYSNKDKEEVAKVVQYLRSNDYNPWFDIDEISPGQRWEQAIMKGISESAVALYFVSENLKENKSFVTEELRAAMSAMRSRDESFSPVIPVRLDDSDIPNELLGVHWVDLRNKDGLEQLERGLKRVLGQA